MRVKKPATKNAGKWQGTQYANLVRYISSGTYFARIRVHGKLIVKSLKTDALTVAKLRLADLEKAERQAAESNANITRGKLFFEDGIRIYKERISGDVSLKQRTKDYYGERMKALLKSWPELAKTDVRRITKTDCLNWAAVFGRDSSPTAFNHTVKVLRDVIKIGIESGARYDNPASEIKRASERPKKIQLPEAGKFNEFVSAIEKSGGRFSRPCAHLVQFLAYGGFRKSEAANVLWQDCDLPGERIIIYGDPENRTKNGEFRAVPMIPSMKKLLGELKVARPELKPDDPVMQVNECQKAMDRAAKILNMPRITHHDLRHLFATRCIESGVDIPTVSRWLGHKDGGALAMKTYGHLRNEHSRAMAERVNF